jgi:hypothetical protein
MPLKFRAVDRYESRDVSFGVDFEFDPKARRHFLVAADPDLIARIRAVAQRRGLQTESLINLWLEQRVQEAAG